MKYFKPKSLTWWSGLALLAYGVVDTIQSKTISPHIAEGLAAIGLRATIP